MGKAAKARWLDPRRAPPAGGGDAARGWRRPAGGGDAAAPPPAYRIGDLVCVPGRPSDTLTAVVLGWDEAARPHSPRSLLLDSVLLAAGGRRQVAYAVGATARAQWRHKNVRRAGGAGSGEGWAVCLGPQPAWRTSRPLWPAHACAHAPSPNPNAGPAGGA